MSLRATGVTVDIGPARLLSNVDVTIEAGEVVALVGPNGAGKSTLLGVLAGDRAPSAGTVTIDGHELGSLRPIELARRRSVLPQHSTTLFSFDAAAVVAMGRYPCDEPQHDEQIVRASLERVAASHLAHRSFPTLSGGEQTLVGLARVLAQQTPYVLLDEPTAALDLGHQEAVCRIAAELSAEGRAVVVVLHELNLAARYADRIVVLHRGRVVADSTPLEALTSARLSAIYQHPGIVVDHPLVPGRPLVLPTPDGQHAQQQAPQQHRAQQQLTHQGAP